MTNDYPNFVSSIFKPGQAIVDSMDATKAELLHAAVGVSGEAGELLDAIKKHVIYGKPLDYDNVVEESGDILYYLVALLSLAAPELTLEDVMEANRAKLSKRYPDGYSDKNAINRKDK